MRSWWNTIFTEQRISSACTVPRTAHAATTNGRIIDDAVFDAAGSMSAADIQAFLNQFPNSCLKNYTDDMPSADPTRAYFDYSGTGTVAQIIRRIADNYGVNPRVLLTKLEQEENLVTGNAGCAQWRYASAVGFDCADSNNPRTVVFRGTTITTCVSHDTALGVSRQLSKGTWLLKMGKERANGNLSWMIPDDASWNYSGPMTQGNRKRCGSCATVYYDGYWRGVYLESGATASLYNYTPYLGQAFGSIWEGWWGAGTTVGANYSYQLVDQWADKNLMAIPASDTVTWYVQVRNTGNRTWQNTGPNPVRLGTVYPNDRTSTWCTSSWVTCHRPGTMQEATVAPNGIATFAVPMQAPGQIGYQTQSFSLVVEGIKWMGGYITWQATVNNPSLTAQLVSSTIPTALTAGQSVTATVTLKNVGNVTWYKAGSFPIRLGTNPPGRTSSFQAGNWLNAERPVGLAETSVPVGGNGTFTFTVTAPAYNGTYTESFKPVAEFLRWIDTPIDTQIVVTGGSDITKVPVYRHYSPASTSHFFTTSLQESQAIRNQGWSYEGIAFYTSSAPTAKPVYRHYNPTLRVHFFTASLQESQAIRNQGWGYEGIAF